MKALSLWVVETDRGTIKPRWAPTVGVGVDRKHGYHVLREWRERNPGVSFRLVKYVPAKKDGE